MYTFYIFLNSVLMPYIKIIIMINNNKYCTFTYIRILLLIHSN